MKNPPTLLAAAFVAAIRIQAQECVDDMKPSITWYVAATHGGEERLELSLSLPFLKDLTLRALFDESDGTDGIRTVTPDGGGVIQFVLESGGGAHLSHEPGAASRNQYLIST